MQGPRKSHTGVFTKTPAITAGAYTANKIVGGLLTLLGACGDYCNGVIQSIVVKDNANQKAALTLLFFREPPTGIGADAAAIALSAADMAKCVGKVNVAAADYETVAGKAIAVVFPGLVVSGHVPVAADGAEKFSATSNLYMVVVTTGTPTYAAVDDLTFEVGTLQD